MSQTRITLLALQRSVPSHGQRSFSFTYPNFSSTPPDWIKSHGQPTHVQLVEEINTALVDLYSVWIIATPALCVGLLTTVFFGLNGSCHQNQVNTSPIESKFVLFFPVIVFAILGNAFSIWRRFSRVTSALRTYSGTERNGVRYEILNVGIIGWLRMGLFLKITQVPDKFDEGSEMYLPKYEERQECINSCTVAVLPSYQIE